MECDVTIDSEHVTIDCRILLRKIRQKLMVNGYWLNVTSRFA